MKSCSSREIIRMLEADGWKLDRCSGDHHIYKHDRKPGRVVVPHPVKDIPLGTFRSILKQAGIRL